MIPKLIHQLWIDATIPERFVAFRDGWLRHHPGWTYRLWTDADVAAFVRAAEPGLADLLDGHDRAICRADIARYLILKHHGGLYVDLDFECLRPLDPLLDGASLSIGLEPESHLATNAAQARNFSRILCPSLIACRPGHPFWDAVTADLAAARAKADVLDATGPFLLTRTYERLARQGLAGDVRLLPAAAVYPVDKFACWDGGLHDLAFRELATRRAFAVHHWDGGWFRSPKQRAQELKVALTGPAEPQAPDPGDPLPLVSCLMVTRGRAAQARLAVACFQAQTYPNRELVIVEDGDDATLAEAVAGDPRIRHHRTGDPAPVLGRARNRAVALARGAYVCQWDDDDLYDAERLAMQMAALRGSGARACLLARWTIWWPGARRLATSRRRAWEGSILCEREILPAYPELARGEDTPVVEALLARVRVVHLDAPRLYLYVVHGRNTFTGPHFDEHWDAAEARFAGDRYAAILEEVAKRLPVAAYAALAAPEPDWDEAVAAAGRFLMSDCLDEAGAAFERLRRRNPSHPAGLDGLARVASRSWEWVAALERWDELCAVFPEHGPGLLGRGQALLELGRTDEARAVFQAASRQPRHHAQAEAGLAETAVLDRDWRGSLAAWRAILHSQPESSRAVFGVVQALAELGELAAAEAELRSAAGLTPRDRLSATALLLQKRHRDTELVDLLARHPDLVSADPSLKALRFQLEQGRGRAREALRAASGGANEAAIEALGAIYAPDADPEHTLPALYALWRRHGLAVATPDLLALLVRAAEQAAGAPGAGEVLGAVEALPLDRALHVRLNLIAVFERLRFDPAARAPDALRRLAGRRDPRAPFGRWREALFRIAQAYEAVHAAYPNNSIDSAWREASARQVAERIAAAARQRQPFSLIRLGDGEGNFLAYPEAQAWHAHGDREATQRIWWGEPRLAASEATRMSEALQEAVRDADIVGIPDPARLVAGLPLPCPEDPYATGHDMRGLLVILDHLVRAARQSAEIGLFRPEQLLTSCHIHADLAAFGLYEALFAEIGSVAVLTCHTSLAERLRIRFGLTVTRTILIPHERKYGSVFGYAAGEQHYPDAFERLRETLAPTHPGEVVLVAAGFLGKLYCHWIRSRGGIALDVGSIVDHWCGFNTRSLQFRQRYAGPARRPMPSEPDRPTVVPAPTTPPAASGRLRIARDRTALQAWDVTRSGPVGVNLFAEVGKATGIGRAGAGSLAALRAAGVPVHLVDPHASPAAGRSQLPYPVNLFHLNPWSLLDKGTWQTGVFDAETFSHRVNIGCWAWESATTFPETWRPALGLLDEVWVPSRFTAEALSSVVPLPIRVVPHALDLSRGPTFILRSGREEAFRFGFVFDELSGFERKNPLGLIDAFRRAFPAGEARLVLKARTLSAHRREAVAQACSGHPGISLDVGELSREDLLAWIVACDAYVSLHRAEGFGLTVAEAMALGTPVVATGYSGVSEFLDDTTGYPVPFTMNELAEAREAYSAGTVWAEPDLDAAAAAMRRVRDRPGEAAQRAERARVRVAERYSAETIGRQMRAELNRIIGTTPSRLRPTPVTSSNRATKPCPKVLVLTPVRNAAHALGGYFTALKALDFPADRLDVAFLEGDSSDDSLPCLEAHARDLVRRGHRTQVLRKNFDVRFAGPRWAPEIQRLRRAGIARARNWLLGAALGDADWVLWIDADVIAYPPDTLTRLLAAERQIVVPHCVLTPGGPTFDLNSFRAAKPAHLAQELVGSDGLLQPPRGEGRLYLEDFRDHSLVELDAVGASMLLVRADIHREGFVFPVVPVGGLIETEGFAAMAREAGHRCWGLPGLEIVHASA
ncbi:glycosyltransferase [Methylobacterium sp. A54F]